jgi:hypothetical protein
MERWAGLGITATVLVLVAAGASGQYQRMTGNFWKDMPDIARVAYAAGFIDGMIAATTAPDSSAGVAKCVADTMPYGQINAIVSKYVADHPEKWHLNLSALAATALWEACGRP